MITNYFFKVRLNLSFFSVFINYGAHFQAFSFTCPGTGTVLSTFVQIVQNNLCAKT